MAAKQWFTIQSGESAQVVYLVSADCEEVVQVIAGGICSKPIITRLTWQQLHDWTGGVIPAGSNPLSLASGNFMIPKLGKPDIVLWPI